MQFITENLSDCTEVKILTAILNRDSENIGGYLGEYFNKINKDTSLNKMSVTGYMKDVSKFYLVNSCIKNLKNSKEVKELREETKLLKEKIENANKVGSTLEELDEIKQKVHKNKMILKELKTFEMNTKDMLNVKILEPIYCRKQSIDFEIK